MCFFLRKPTSEITQKCREPHFSSTAFPHAPSGPAWLRVMWVEVGVVWVRVRGGSGVVVVDAGGGGVLEGKEDGGKRDWWEKD